MEIKDREHFVTISISEYERMHELINAYRQSFVKIHRYTTFEHHGLEFIRDEVMYVLDK